MRRPHLGYLFLVLTFAIFAVTGTVHAHTKSQSFSSWSATGDKVVMSFTVAARQVTLLPLVAEGGSLEALLNDHLTSAVTVKRGQALCAAAAPKSLAAKKGFVRAETVFTCPASEAGELLVEMGAFFPVSARHVHFARTRSVEGDWEEVIFTDTNRSHVLAALSIGEQGERPSNALSVWIGYVWLGIEHILEGVDHLAFVFALLLLCSRARDVVFVVTGFTVGHSITLSLVVLGVISPNIPVIESLIGFTIAFVGAELLLAPHGHLRRGLLWATCFLAAFAFLSLLVGGLLPLVTWAGLALFVLCYAYLVSTPQETQRWAPVLTVLFGLIHGAGFAAVLMEIGLPKDRLFAALFGFNVGVEIGQLLVVGLLALAAVAIREVTTEKTAILVRDGSAAILVSLGVFWFVGRAFAI